MKKWDIFRAIRTLPVSMGFRLILTRFFLERGYARASKDAKGSGTDPEDVWEDWRYDFYELEDDETGFHSHQLLKQARKLRLPVPQMFVDDGVLSVDYMRSGMLGNRYYLSPHGEVGVRAAIREEERYRSERRTRLIPYITALSGLVGTTAGLVALLVK